MMLHSARSTPDNPRHAAELSTLIGAASAWTEAERDHVTQLAAATGAGIALRDVLPLMGVQVPIDGAAADPARLAAWQRRLEGRDSSAGGWFALVSQSRGLGRIIVLRNALWPSEEWMRSNRPLPLGRCALNRARLHRIFHGVAAFPSTILGMLGHERANVVRAVTHPERRRDPSA